MFRSILFLLSGTLFAQDLETLFTNTIQPVLHRDCLGCHGSGQTIANLDLRTRESMLRGGVSGPVIVPGNAAKSLLLQAVEANGKLKMPPAARLAPDVVAAIQKWIDGGAPVPVAVVAKDAWGRFKAEDLWAFQPLRKKFEHDSIDAFLNAKLAFTPAAKSDHRTLIRRVTIDLTGLPPTPEDVDAFAADPKPDAYARMIDRLLASRAYGERWGRHWLDVVRYADTGGYSNDFERPNAWRYRDYVIRAFHNDKPYDRFVKEQIAGDELYPGDAEALIATGMLRAGPWEHTGMSVEAVTRQMFLDDVTAATGAAFLGLTTGCARCHDHKFDPISTKDYYRLQAVFASTEFARPAVPFLPGENIRTGGRERLERADRETKARIDEFEALALSRALKKLGVTSVEPAAANKIRREKTELTPAEFEEFKLHQKHMQLYRESLDRYSPKAFAVSSGPMDGATDGGPNLKYPKRADYKAPETAILTGGNIQSPAEKVTPGVLSAVGRYGAFAEPEVSQAVEGRRAALANWIASPANPLTARVMVNRIWQGHFGRGIAADTNNFGKMGSKATHPELLDWLAARFIAGGWSMKNIHRMILLSDAYQRSSTAPAEAAIKDPSNTLLSYFTPRRVEAEVIRDSILAAAGELSAEGGGPGSFPQINEDAARQPQHRMGSLAPAYQASARKADRNKRTVYTFQQRSLMDPMVDVFNGASMDLSCERRESSIVPTQAFTLLNSQFTHDMALAMAARAERESEKAPIERLFQLAYGRKPTSAELDLSQRHYQRMLAHHKANSPAPPAKPEPIVHTIMSELTGDAHLFTQRQDLDGYEPNLHPSQASASTRALSDLALSLLNSNEFVYVY